MLLSLHLFHILLQHPPMLSPLEQKALQFLVSPSITQAQVAAALGVTEGMISQIAAKEEFQQLLAAERLKSLNTQVAIDAKYNEIESKLLDKLQGSVDMMFRPIEVIKALSVVNGAKRRGTEALTPSTQSSAPSVVINLPVQLVKSFTTDVQNQVVRVGDQDLVTIQSAALAQKVGLSNEPVTISTPNPSPKIEAARQGSSKEASRAALLSPDNY